MFSDETTGGHKWQRSPNESWPLISGIGTPWDADFPKGTHRGTGQLAYEKA